MKLSVCMIVKNEEEYLEECLRGIAGRVYEIIVVDTGSDDRTKEIALKYSDKYYEYLFQEDFAAARNYSISFAEGEWILALDADERIDEKNLNKIIDYLQGCDNHIGGIRVTKYNFFKNGGWYISNAVKVFRNDSQIRFEGKVNESVSESVKAAGYVNNQIGVFINHIGHSKSYQSRRAKNNKYLSIFRERIKESPNDIGLKAYVAVLERAEGHLNKAIKLIEEDLDKAVSNNDFMFMLFSGHVYKASEMYKKAEACYRKALDIIPNEPNVVSNIGVIYACMGKLDEAEKVIREGIAENSDSWFLYMNLGLVYEMKGEYGKALNNYDVAYQGNPYFSYQHPMAKVEEDPFCIFYFETFPHYAGYAYHRAYCKEKFEETHK